MAKMCCIYIHSSRLLPCFRYTIQYYPSLCCCALVFFLFFCVLVFICVKVSNFFHATRLIWTKKMELFVWYITIYKNHNSRLTVFHSYQNYLVVTLDTYSDINCSLFLDCAKYYTFCSICDFYLNFEAALILIWLNITWILLLILPFMKLWFGYEANRNVVLSWCQFTCVT